MDEDGWDDGWLLIVLMANGRWLMVDGTRVIVDGLWSMATDGWFTYIDPIYLKNIYIFELFDPKNFFTPTEVTPTGKKILEYCWKCKMKY